MLNFSSIVAGRSKENPAPVQRKPGVFPESALHSSSIDWLTAQNSDLFVTRRKAQAIIPFRLFLYKQETQTTQTTIKATSILNQSVIVAGGGGQFQRVWQQVRKNKISAHPGRNDRENRVEAGS
jgi:hypothetical protein